MGKLMLKGQ